MSTITFDTFEFNKTLREAGFDEKQAEALTRAQSKAIEQAHEAGAFATKMDLHLLESNLYKAMLLQTFAIAGFMAGLLALAAKLFLPA